MFSRQKRLSRSHEFRKQQLKHVEKNLQNTEPAARKKKQYIVALVLVLSSLTIALYTIFFSPIFKIKEVIVSNEGTINSLDQTLVNDTFQYLIGRNIFLNSARSISEFGVRSLPRLKEVRVTMAYPETVKISVREKAILLALPMSDKFALINEDGIVVKLTPAIDEQILKTFIQVDSDHKLDTFYLNQQLFSLDQIRYIITSRGTITEKTGFNITAATWFPDRKEVHLLTDQEFSIWLDTDLTVDTQVNKLLSIYPSIQSSKKKVQYIDLRIPERAIVGN
ncbi:MAG: hypothetical protein HY817_04450 [Candidatus Abawacabacteria bacterium]|nr:hypothetical protein [Candidatus Abawacabacteria bacterium]